jgi:hypothetical protein
LGKVALAHREVLYTRPEGVNDADAFEIHRRRKGGGDPGVMAATVQQV